jgi:hypothetical protein
MITKSASKFQVCDLADGCGRLEECCGASCHCFGIHSGQPWVRTATLHIDRDFLPDNGSERNSKAFADGIKGNKVVVCKLQ